MIRKIVEWTIEYIYTKRNQINFPDFQREAHLWQEKDNSLLIDSILRDIDIPKLYFYESGKNEYEVIDGQQRLWAIWGFLDNEFKCEIPARKEKQNFMQLSNALKQKILSYKLQITIIDEVNEDYLRTLFLRLQLGTLLVTGEKLHASTGMMRDFVFNTMLRHQFIKKIQIPERRFAKQTLCAQICINSFDKSKISKFARTRYEDLKYFFSSYVAPEGNDLDFFNNKCNSIISNLDLLNKYFKDKSSKLKIRSFILSVYLFVEELVSKKEDINLGEIMPLLVEFILELLKRLKAESKAGFKRKNEELYKFQSYLSNAPGERYQIDLRHQKLKIFFDYYRKNKKIMGD